MTQFKVGDTVRVINPGRTFTTHRSAFERFGFRNLEQNDSFKAGTIATVFNTGTVNGGPETVSIRDGIGRECLINISGVELVQPLMITKEKILEAAAKCSTAKETLKTLFPEVFNEECEIKWDERKGAFKINGFTALYVETGEFGRKGLEFHLDSNFDWEIKGARMGKQLIPTPK